jgi:uncharacterized membrane protein
MLEFCTLEGGYFAKNYFCVPCNLWSLPNEFPDRVAILRPVNLLSGEPQMSKQLLTASTLSAAVGLALAFQALPVQAQGTKEMPQIVKDNMERMAKNKLEKCYGINAVAKNDCGEGAHSCAGQATKARDTKSFVMLPAGDCSKIQGGKLTAS